MSSSILDLLNQQLGGDAVNTLSRRIGADPDTTQKAVASALPMLMTALANNTNDRQGTSSLVSALDRDHDGSILDDVAGFFGQGDTRGGEGILGHVLGRRRDVAAEGVSRMSGLDAGSAAKLMAMLAPLVMGALGRARRQNRLDDTGISDVLRGERRRVEQTSPEGMGMFARILDADGDGQVGDDVARIGASMLGNLFGNRR